MMQTRPDPKNNTVENYEHFRKKTGEVLKAFLQSMQIRRALEARKNLQAPSGPLAGQRRATQQPGQAT